MVTGNSKVHADTSHATTDELLAQIRRRLVAADPDMPRPYVTLCYAQSLDGSIAGVPRRPLALSCAASLVFVHQLRALHDGILVGIGTVLSDDPRLTVRLVPGKHPQPVVLDSHLRFPIHARLLQEKITRPWIAAAEAAAPEKQSILAQGGARILRFPADCDGLVPLAPLLRELRREGIHTLMVEGGARIISRMLAQGLADQLVVTLAPCLVGGLRAVLPCCGIAPPEVLELHNPHYQQYGDDLVIRADFPRGRR